jgi:tripartite-type tricarboxylate transporter receptor subunit TctC
MTSLLHPILPSNRRQACVRIAAAALAIPGLNVFAQAYPSRPVRIIVPFTPGGSSDVLARAIAQDLGRALASPW